MFLKQVSNNLARLASVSLISLLLSATAHAVPKLQLDITDGYYDTTNSDTVTTDSTFEILALLTPPARTGGQTDAEWKASIAAYFAETYYISLAVSPTPATGADLGSITVGGTTVAVTADMEYGIPPLDETLIGSSTTNDQDAQDLVHSRDIFPTYFYEMAFTFSFDGETCTTYDAQDATGLADGGCSGGTGTWVARINVDASLLETGYGLHMDFYSTKVASVNPATELATDIDRDAFAPFSHDAEYRCCTDVPEPGVIGLLGIGLLGLGFARRRKSAVLTKQ